MAIRPALMPMAAWGRCMIAGVYLEGFYGSGVGENIKNSFVFT